MTANGAAGPEEYDVIVAGSGAAGMVTAMRAHDLGLSVLIVERTHKFGGTSATSGGVLWAPMHGLGGVDDTRESALAYIDAVSEGAVRRDRQEAYVDTVGPAVDYLVKSGVALQPRLWPDYFQRAPDARMDRCLVHPKVDGYRLGDKFHLLREQFTRFKLFNRYAMDFDEANTIASRGPGWVRTLGKVMGRYWVDLPARRKSKRDRWLSLGGALMGAIAEQVLKRGIEIRLGTTVDKLVTRGGRVVGVETNTGGARRAISARRGVVICAGGFEKNQRLRDKFLTIPGTDRWSSTPDDGSWGEAMEAAMDIGAATEFTETTWMIPTMILPMPDVSNYDETHQAVFDVGRPHSLCVNRNGDRFVDETTAYDRFGNGMLSDHLKTGANAPCWMIFDNNFRAKFPAGGFLPKAIMPDRKIPQGWWDHYIFKSDTVAGLAAKIGIDPGKLQQTVGNMNAYAKSGVDPEFDRGGDLYDQAFGDPSVKPNPCLGSVDEPPFYAIRIYLGDIGSKGGLKADADARVLDRNDRPIPGLYAAGNASGSVFGNCYPGAGASIGPASVFGFRAANDIAAGQSPPAA